MVGEERPDSQLRWAVPGLETDIAWLVLSVCPCTVSPDYVCCWGLMHIYLVDCSLSLTRLSHEPPKTCLSSPPLWYDCDSKLVPINFLALGFDMTSLSILYFPPGQHQWKFCISTTRWLHPTPTVRTCGNFGVLYIPLITWGSLVCVWALSLHIILSYVLQE